LRNESAGIRVGGRPNLKNDGETEHGYKMTGKNVKVPKGETCTKESHSF